MPALATTRWRLRGAETATTMTGATTTTTEMSTMMGKADAKTARLPPGVISFEAAPGPLAAMMSGQGARVMTDDVMTVTPVAVMTMAASGSCQTLRRSTSPRFSASPTAR